MAVWLYECGLEGCRGSQGVLITLQGYGKYGIRRVWLDATEPERYNTSDQVGLWKFSMGTDAEIGEAWVWGRG